MDKNGFIRTLESFTAILLTIIFLMIVLPSNPINERDKVNFEILNTLSQDDDFRNCIINYNNSCVGNYIEENINFGYYNFAFNISSDYNTKARLSQDNVYLKTYFFMGNSTMYSPRILKLYYWNED